MSFARASVLSSAVLLGIANMRKRRFRTVLTSVTIVLITFAVLCFTSATRYLDTTTLPTGDPSAYGGVMLRQRGFRPLPEFLRPKSHVEATVLSARHIVKSFGGIKAVQGIDISIKDCTLHALIGPIGAG